MVVDDEDSETVQPIEEQVSKLSSEPLSKDGMDGLHSASEDPDKTITQDIVDQQKVYFKKIFAKKSMKIYKIFTYAVVRKRKSSYKHNMIQIQFYFD